MVSAHAARLRLTLATLEAEKGSEIDAALGVLGLLALKGKVVTADALHCNRRTVAKINERGGDWLLALEANQDSLLSDARSCFGKMRKGHPIARTEERGHGRIETREAVVVAAKGLAERREFPGLKAFGRIASTRDVDGEPKSETRSFALSHKPDPNTFLDAARAHWAIENSLHWRLDVSFREDASRNRKDNGPANHAVLRRRALDLVRRDKSKISLSTKLKKAGWNDDRLLSLLNSSGEA